MPHTWRLETTEIYSFTVLEARSPKSKKVLAGLCSLQRLEGSILLGHFLGLWQRNSNLCLHSHMPFSLCFSASSPFLSLMRTLVIGFRVHPDNPRRCQIKILHMITSAATLSPRKVAFTSSRGSDVGMSFFGAIVQPTPQGMKCVSLLPPQEKGGLWSGDM